MQVGTLRRLSVAEFASGAILSAKWPIMRPLNRGPAASTPARRPLFSLSIFLGEDGVVGRVRGQLRGHVGGGSPPLDVLHAGMVGPLQRRLGAPGSPAGVRKKARRRAAPYPDCSPSSRRSGRRPWAPPFSPRNPADACGYSGRRRISSHQGESRPLSRRDSANTSQAPTQ